MPAPAQFAENVLTKYQARVEQAVNRGLDYLAEQQLPGGAFPGSRGDSCGVTAFVGMAFLSAGHTPGQGPYGNHINRCLDHILACQKDNGVLNKGSQDRGMYSHNIATLFLSEVSGMLDPERQRKVDRALAKATAVILDAQNIKKSREADQGGWRYEPNSRDSDMSCSGWALMALRSAKLNGATVPDSSIEAAVKYIYNMHDTRKGTFGYRSGHDSSETLTGAALLCLELCGQHGSEATIKAGNYILSIYKQHENVKHPYYAVYYNAQAMFQLGGKYWETYATWMYDTWLPAQKEDGTFYNPRGKNPNSDVYRTAMMVLSFTVPYRQLPIYQRDETVDEE